MAVPAVPRSWVWHARLRAAAGRATMALGPVFLVTIGSRTAPAVTAAFVVGVLVVVFLVSVRGPSPTGTAVAGALRTGRPPAGLSLALVDTEAAARLREGGWARRAWMWAGLWIALVVGLLVVKGATAGAVAFGSAFIVTLLASTWSLTASVREASRWRAGADERWAAWSATNGSSVG